MNCHFATWIHCGKIDIFNPWPETLTYDLDIRTSPTYCQDEPQRQISRQEVTDTDTQTHTHTHQIDCCIPGPSDLFMFSTLPRLGVGIDYKVYRQSFTSFFHSPQNPATFVRSGFQVGSWRSTQWEIWPHPSERRKLPGPLKGLLTWTTSTPWKWIEMKLGS